MNEELCEKARGALRDAEAQLMLAYRALGELGMSKARGQVHDAVLLCSNAAAEAVMAHLSGHETVGEWLNRHVTKVREGMDGSVYPSYQPGDLAPGGLLTKPGPAIIGETGPEYILPVSILEWFRAQGKDQFRLETFSTAGVPPQSTHRVTHMPTGLHATGSSLGEALANLRDWMHRDANGNLRYFYGEAPDLGSAESLKMTHYGCGGSVLYIDGGHICECGMQDKSTEDEEKTE